MEVVPLLRRCFEQEEVRLGIGLDAVALGRNIDHGVGGRVDGRRKGESEMRGAQMGCLRALSSSSASLCREAQGERKGRERAEGPAEALQRAHSLHAHVEYNGCSLNRDTSLNSIL